MSASRSVDPRPGRHRVRRLASGGALVLAADALQLPSALLLGAFLGRQLGVEGLALYLLAAAVVTWIELVVSALFSRATVQMVAEAEDWRPIASLVLRWHAGLGFGAAAALALALLLFDELFGVAGLKRALLLFALEIPLFALARSHTHVLVGLGRYRARAIAGAVRWTSRLVLSVGLVALGFGVEGAVLGAVASTALELVAARIAVRPRFGTPATAAHSARLRELSAPLFAHGVALQLFHRLGLLVLVPLGATVAAAGIYGAADSLLRLRRVLGQSLTPLLLSALAGLKRDGDEAEAARLARQALRLAALAVVPVAAVAGAAAPLMAWIFGAEFAPGGATLALLVWGAPAFLLLSVASAILIAAGRPRVTAWLTAPMVPLALAAYALTVPRWGVVGAAFSTSAIAAAAAFAALVAVRRLAVAGLPLATAARIAVGGGVAFALARFAPAGFAGAGLLLLLPLAAAAGLAAILALGETAPGELAALRRLVTQGWSHRRRRAAGDRETEARRVAPAPLLDDPD